jgi:SAM-dependent methyltransferase
MTTPTLNLPLLTDNLPLTDTANPISNPSTIRHRETCNICQYQVKRHDSSNFATIPCSIRAFLNQTFQVWRCPQCQTIHTLDVVDLDQYYAQYPLANSQLTWFFRVIYQNILKRFQRVGLSSQSTVLDYGCGASGIFIQYLQELGFANATGYDPYGAKDGFGNPEILQPQAFDYILLQDVIEHVEDPQVLLRQMDHYLKPGGHILVGTPNAAKLDLGQPQNPNFYNLLHVPYHLHIYTPQALQTLGEAQAWQVVGFFDRGYDDTRYFGLNSRAWNAYVGLFDGSYDVTCEPLRLGRMLGSADFLFNALLGYYLSYQTSMSMLFKKPQR